ncbi:MAG: hypothetical protein DHS20C18_52500 [Saprospiraceae bacterium]|nr:MAG: hypothetical protein DHS20C18_52500 [Saprospiraceae bacterium]
MAARLSEINNKAQPEDNYSLNKLRAQQLQQKFQAATGIQQQLDIKWQYAEQLLLAGLTEDALRETNDILSATGGIKPPFTEGKKKFLDLLAISYLHLSDEQNFANNPTSASSIVPIQPQGFHRISGSAEKAIEVYTTILNAFPDDLQSQWLLNVAYMMLGRYPHDVPKKWLINPSVLKPSDNFPIFLDVAAPLNLDVRGLSGGSSIEDYNMDGYLDIFVTSYGLSDQCKFFLNKGDGTFTDHTEAAGLKGIVSGLNVQHADYNNDGYADILILRGAWMGEGGKHPNSLLRNNGDGTFTDVTDSAGLLSFFPTQTAAWADFNRDGWLDLFIGNESVAFQSNIQLKNPCELYINNGDGTFTEVAAKVGLDIIGMIKGASWGDINNDRLPDLYISDLAGNNKLFVNRGGSSLEDWKFEEIGAKAGVEAPFFSFPCWFWDYDNDGFEDIFVSGYDMKRLDLVGYDAALEFLGNPREAETPRLYRNNGNETFTDVTAQTGLDKVMYAMGSNFGDLDNDGYLDFYIGTGTPSFSALVPNRMFRNVEGKRFEEVTMSGFGHLQKGHGISFGDLDNDGDQDIYCVMGGAYEGDLANNILYENPTQGKTWINIILRGNNSNRSGIQAKLKVTTLDGTGKVNTYYRVVNTGGSFGSSSLQQEIGLNYAVQITELEVTWPNSLPQVFKGVNPNANVYIQEGNQELKYLSKPQVKLATEGGHHGHH